MKKILAFLIVIALGAFMLASCGVIGGNEDHVSDVAGMYKHSLPTKVVAKTSQAFGDGVLTLNCEYTIVNGIVDNKDASVYTSVVESIRSVEDGGESDVVESIIETSTTVVEAIDGLGSRTNGGEWNSEGYVWYIERGAMALNIRNSNVTNVAYENGKLECVVPYQNVASVFGNEFSADMASDVYLTITNDGARITSLELVYETYPDEAANLISTTMTVKVDYQYDIEKITIN